MSLLSIVLALYWRLPARARIWLLWAASYLFYGFWYARFLALIFTTTVVDFHSALGITGRRVDTRRVLFACLTPAVWLAICTKFAFSGGKADGSAVVVALLFPILFP